MATYQKYADMYKNRVGQKSAEAMNRYTPT